jgi:zinc protease
MMFQGSKNVGADQHFQVLKKLGSEQINGTTNTDRTNYYEVVPSNELETALWLESDRMSHLLDILDEKQLANQINVVRNERRQSDENRAYTRAEMAAYEALYPEGHPYRHLTIGKHEDLEAASVDDVKQFFRTWYVPANATIAISGDFDVDEAKTLIDKWFGTFPKSEKPKINAVAAPEVSARRVVVSDPIAKLPQVLIAWHAPASFAPNDAELDIASEALSREGPGRLYKLLVYDKQIAQSVSCSMDGMQFSGVFDCSVTLKSDAADKIDDVEKIVFDEIGKLDVTDKDIARFVANKEARTVRAFESTFARSQTLQMYNHFFGDPDKLSWDLDRYRTATPAKVKAAIGKYLTREHAITVITQPGGKS